MTHSVPHEHFRKILFCTDFSANADRAFIFAVNAARRHTDGQLHLLHVIPEPPAQFWKGYIYEVDEDVDARAKREIDEKLAQTYLPRVPEDVQLTIAMRIGQAGQKILDRGQARWRDCAPPSSRPGSTPASPRRAGPCA